MFARLAKKIQAHCHVVRLEANQQLFCERNVFGIGGRFPVTGYGFNK
jgi:hypothetical protein